MGKNILKYACSFILLCFTLLFSMDAMALDMYQGKYGGLLTSDFGWRKHPITEEWKFHNGIDIANPEGSMIPALFSGTVEVVDSGGGYGNFIIVHADNGYYYMYAHCNYILAKEGQRVKQHENIAVLGNTGNSTGPHLHLTMSNNLSVGGYYPEENVIDPLPLVRSVWDLSGNIMARPTYFGQYTNWEANAIAKHLTWEMDYKAFINPTETLSKMTKEFIEKIKESSPRIGEGIKALLFALMLVHLAWYMARSILLDEFNIVGIASTLFMYGMLIISLENWETWIDSIFVNFFSTVASTLIGTEITIDNFLGFSNMMNEVIRILGDNVTPKYTIVKGLSGIFIFLLQNVLAMAMAVVAFIAACWVTFKVIVFFLNMVWAVIGLPLFLMFGIRQNGKMVLGTILSTATELVLIAFLIHVVVEALKLYPTLEPNSVASVIALLFTVAGMLFITYKNSFSLSSYFSQLWN